MENLLKKSIKDLAELLSKPHNVLLVSHINPDGDAIGSTMGMYHFLQKTGHNVKAMVPNAFPDFLAWLPGTKNIIVFQENNKAGKEAIEKADLIFCIDFNDFKRLKEISPLLEAAPAKKILIDHHPNPPENYEIMIHDMDVSSTAELVYTYIKESGHHECLDENIGTCIYCGIMTDTGCFSFNSSTPGTFYAVADLLSCGINKDMIFDQVYNNFSYQRMKLMGYCLNEKMVTIPDLHTAYISLTTDEMNKYQFKTGDSEGFVNLPFSIKGIQIAVLFTEKKENIRISMRSKGDFPVNEICQKYFSGGGHKNASGGESNLSLTETIEKFEQVILSYQDEIIRNYGR